MKNILLGLVLIFSFSHLQAQSKSTVLWSISGKGISHPSYLFGTIHVKDKRAFNFSDSVLLKLDECQAFAMETNLDSIVWYMFKSMDENSELKLKNLFGEKEYSKMDQEMQDAGIDPATIKNKNPLLLKQFMNPFGKQADDMPTFLDAYLYNIARRSGKSFIAVEDFHDQLALFDKLTQNVQKDIIETEYVAPQKFYTKKLIDLYVASDLAGIDASMKLMSAEMYASMITNRNMKMSESIDSIIQHQSTFIAIGSGHLPGTDGVIELLRKKGYSVRPVYNTYKGVASQYKVKEVVLPWNVITNPQAGYSIDMPALPFPLNIALSDYELKSCVDFGTGLSYFTMALYVSKNADLISDDDKILSQLKQNWGKKGIEILESKIILGLGGKIYSFSLKSKKVYLRTQIQIANNFAYLNMVGAEDKRYLNSMDADRYFNSLKLFPIKPKTWEMFTSREGSFEVYLPEKPKESNIEIPAKNDNKAMNRMMSSTDNISGIQYVAQYFDGKGIYFPSDSTFFKATFSKLIKSIKPIRHSVKTIHLDNFSGKEYMLHLKDSSYFRVQSYLRGSRGYTLISLVPAGKHLNPEIQTFFNSFKFLPGNTSEWKIRSSADSSFSVATPDEFAAEGLNQYSSTGYDTITNFTAYDKYSGTSFVVVKNIFSDYFFTSRLDSIFRDNLELSIGDTIIQSNQYQVDKLPAAAYVVQNASSSNLKKVIFILKGKELYTIQTHIPKSYLNHSEYLRFFQSFSLNNHPADGDILTNKTKKIIKDISSTDSLTREKAKAALEYDRFHAIDMPLLYAAVLKSYPDDSLNYNSTKSAILDAIAINPDGSFIPFLKNNYYFFRNLPQYQVKLLTILAKMHTDSSQHLLVDYLMNTPPQYAPHELFTFLEDSLKQSKFMFPSVLKLYSNPLYRQPVLSFTNKMLSNKQISIDTLSGYYTTLMDDAKKELYQKSPQDDDYDNDMIDILGFIRNDSAVNLLNQYCKIKNSYKRMIAVLNLLEIGKSVESSILMEIAKTIDLRIIFYNRLQKIDRLNYFPEKYKTQREIAQGRVWYDSDFEDVTIDKIELKAERILMFKGKQQRFYLYKVITHDSEIKSAYFGISGPYPLDTNLITPTEKLPTTNGLIYNTKTLNEHLLEYMETYNSPEEE